MRGTRGDGLLAAAALIVGLGTACSGPAASPSASPSASSSASAPSTSPATGSPSPTPEPVTEVQVQVRDGRVVPPPGRVAVPLGQRVRLTVTSDVADELHVHGYDREAALSPGEPTTVEFVADEAGQFEVETHESGLVLLTLQVR